jgi:hypothetical protein
MEQDEKIDVSELMGPLICEKDFQCCMSGLEDLCKAKSVGGGSYLVCLQKYPTKCPFISIKHGYMCRCPLRIYLAKKLKK